MLRRRTVMKEFGKYKQHADNRTMDEICQPASGAFELQVQQQFLRDFIRRYAQTKCLMLYHSLGAGKTASAIVMAEVYRRKHPGTKVTVILPARLRSNFTDELMSPVTEYAYISRTDYALISDVNTPMQKKRAIRAAFLKKIGQVYDIMSFEKMRSMALKAGLAGKSVRQWAAEFSKDRFVIVDEAHNLVSNSYKVAQYQVLDEGGKVSDIPGRVVNINALLFKTLVKHAADSARFVLLTATPVFDNITQFVELAKIIRSDVPTMRGVTLADVMQLLRGHISYFPGISSAAYPSVTYETHNVVMSKIQEDIINHQQIDDMSEVDFEMPFFITQRQFYIAADKQRAVIDPENFAPKLFEIVKKLNTLPGKHVIYSTFIDYGLKLVAGILARQGWVDVHDVINGKVESVDYKVYAFWDGATKDAEKEMIKRLVNSTTNIDGRLVKVILGSPSIKEGVSFKHAQHMHLLDPVWNQSAKSQIEGRVIRFCSHVDIPENHPTLKRHVTIHIYKLVYPPQNGYNGLPTIDGLMYDVIIPKKQHAVEKAERALKKVAFDYFLFRKLWKANASPSPGSDKSNVTSVVAPTENFNIEQLRKNGAKKKGDTCPKKRHPPCATGFEKRQNKQGYDCCYKVRVKK